MAEFLSGCRLKHALGFCGHFCFTQNLLSLIACGCQSEDLHAETCFTHIDNVATFRKLQQSHWRLSSKSVVCCPYCMLLMYSKISCGILWSCLRRVWWPDNMCS
jgi:hypothetical protein